MTASTPENAITALTSAAAGALGNIDHPAVRMFAARLRDSASEVPHGEPSEVPAVGHLSAACVPGDGAPSLRPALDAITAAHHALAWRQSCRPDAPDLYNDNHAFVELVGPNGHLHAKDIRFGLFLLGPDVFYPSHVHEAEEIYLILSGASQWQQDDAPFRAERPGAIVHNVSMRPHAMQVGTEPLLMFWGWCGDIGWAQYRFV